MTFLEDNFPPWVALGEIVEQPWAVTRLSLLPSLLLMLQGDVDDQTCEAILCISLLLHLRIKTLLRRLAVFSDAAALASTYRIAALEVLHIGFSPTP